jgi:hypothetical protein
MQEPMVQITRRNRSRILKLWVLRSAQIALGMAGICCLWAFCQSYRNPARLNVSGHLLSLGYATKSAIFRGGFESEIRIYILPNDTNRFQYEREREIRVTYDRQTGLRGMPRHSRLFKFYFNIWNSRLGISAHVIKVQFQIWVFFVFIAIFVWIVRIVRNRQRCINRLQDGLCVYCGYDIRSAINLCPECGAKIVRKKADRQNHMRRNASNPDQ